MSVNRDTIDQHRKLQSLPPLTDEEFAALNGGGGSDEEAKLKAEEDEKKKLADASKPADQPKDVIQSPPATPQLSDDEIMKIVAQKTGRNVSSWDDLKNKEVVDEEKKKEERDSNKISWGLQNKIVSKKEYEGFISDSKDPIDLVFRHRLQEARKEDPTIDEKEFKEEFDEEFGLTSGEDTRRFKNGKKTLQHLAEGILKTTYSSIYQLENQYSSYESAETSKAEKFAKVKEGAPAYKKTIENIKGQLKKIKHQFSETDSIEVEALDETINEVVNMMSDPDWAAHQILKGYTEEELKDIAFTTVLKKDWPTIVNEISKQYLNRHAAGTKGIPVVHAVGDYPEGGLELTDAQKALKGLIEADKPKQPEGALN